MTAAADTRRMRLLGRWGEWACRHWAKALLFALGITLVLGSGISRLKLELSFYSIMPKGSQQVRDLKKITESFPAANSIVAVLEADAKDPDAEKQVTRAVDALAAEISRPEYAPYVARVQSRLDLEFFRSHGLMLSEEEDIERLRRLFSDLNLVPFFRSLNDDFEREYSGNEEKLSEDEAEAAAQIEGLAGLLDLAARAAGGAAPGAEEIDAGLDRFLFGSPYFLSRDNSRALLIIQPTFDINDIEIYTSFVPRLERIVKQRAAELGVSAGLTGLLVVGKDEMETSERGLAVSMLIAVVLILALLIVSFRMYAVPLIAGIPLILGLVWTAGLTGWALSRLNIMTAMYMVALLGLGIDYAIHLLTNFTQERSAGSGVPAALSASMRKSGSGILTGALTTAIAFFALTVAESEVVRELGLVAGMGILAELASMFILIPALLGLRARRLEKRGKAEPAFLARLSPGYGFMAALGARIKGLPLLALLVPLTCGLLLATRAGRVEVEGNLMNMEARGLESVELQDLMVDEFGMAPDLLSVTGPDLEELRSLAKKLEKLASVKEVESLAAFYPSAADQERRAVLAREFSAATAPLAAGNGLDAGELAGEIRRLEDNLLEMSDLAFMGGLSRLQHTLENITGRDDSGARVSESGLHRLLAALSPEGNTDAGGTSGLTGFQSRFVPLLKEKLLAMSSAQRITLDMVPAEWRDSYLSADGRDFLLNILPAGNPWQRRYREILTAQVGTVTGKATGMVLAADQMIQIAEQDGLRAAVVALLVIFAVLVLDFRNVKLSLLTLFPLLLSIVSLFGIMALAGIKFDFINIIAVPLLIGIGVDDAVHFNHRYLLEGPGRMDAVIAATGKAVLLTSLTTIIGFASFIPSVMRAMRSTGIVLSLAMALAFIFSVTFHPAALLLTAERLKLNIQPWNQGGKSS
jgi:predicted RND superfamily exporter protein